VKRLLAKLDALLMESEMVDHKVLERIRVFIVYMAGMYKPLTPFLVGLHLTISIWRPGRDEEGWRLRQADVGASLELDEDSVRDDWKGAEEGAPQGLVRAVPILMDYLDVSIQLTEVEAPPLQ
jgi:hypothetical protein